MSICRLTVSVFLFARLYNIIADLIMKKYKLLLAIIISMVGISCSKHTFYAYRYCQLYYIQNDHSYEFLMVDTMSRFYVLHCGIKAEFGECQVTNDTLACIPKYFKNTNYPKEYNVDSSLQPCDKYCQEKRFRIKGIQLQDLEGNDSVYRILIPAKILPHPLVPLWFDDKAYPCGYGIEPE